MALMGDFLLSIWLFYLHFKYILVALLLFFEINYALCGHILEKIFTELRATLAVHILKWAFLSSPGIMLKLLKLALSQPNNRHRGAEGGLSVLSNSNT